MVRRFGIFLNKMAGPGSFACGLGNIIANKLTRKANGWHNMCSTAKLQVLTLLNRRCTKHMIRWVWLGPNIKKKRVMVYMVLPITKLHPLQVALMLHNHIRQHEKRRSLHDVQKSRGRERRIVFLSFPGSITEKGTQILNWVGDIDELWLGCARFVYELNMWMAWKQTNGSWVKDRATHRPQASPKKIDGSSLICWA